MSKPRTSKKKVREVSINPKSFQGKQKKINSYTKDELLNFYKHLLTTSPTSSVIKAVEQRLTALN